MNFFPNDEDALFLYLLPLNLAFFLYENPELWVWGLNFSIVCVLFYFIGYDEGLKWTKNLYDKYGR